MPATPAIRPIDDGDIDAVIALWRASDLLRPWNDPHADIAFARRTPEAEIFVGIENGAVVATILCGNDGHRGWLYYLAVAPARREAGLGRAMVAHAEAWLKALGLPKVELLIRDTNAGVARFYESLGYAREPRIIMSRWLQRPPALPDD